MKKISNDEKIKIVKKRKLLKVLIIIFGLATLVLAMFSLFDKLSPIYAIITFIVEALLSNYRNKLDPKVVSSDLKNQE